MSPSCFNFRLWLHRKFPVTSDAANDENRSSKFRYFHFSVHTVHVIMYIYIYMYMQIFVYILYKCYISPTSIWNAVLLHWQILLVDILFAQVIEHNNLVLVSNWCMYGRPLPWMPGKQEVVVLRLPNYHFRGTNIWVTSRTMFWSW